MGKKIIITESQLDRLVSYIQENDTHQIMVRRIAKDLDMNYEPIIDIVNDGDEYFEKGMVRKKLDDETISPKALLNYLHYKYKISKEFIKQVIDDWYRGKLGKDNMLSKNVSL